MILQASSHPLTALFIAVVIALTPALGSAQPRRDSEEDKDDAPFVPHQVGRHRPFRYTGYYAPSWARGRSYLGSASLGATVTMAAVDDIELGDSPGMVVPALLDGREITLSGLGALAGAGARVTLHTP